MNDQTTYYIAALMSGEKWPQQGDTTSLSYSFPFSTRSSANFSTDYGNGEPGYAISGFNQQHQQAAKRALEQWSNVANISFNEVEDGASSYGDIRFSFIESAASPGAWGYAYLPATYTSFGQTKVSDESGDIWVINAESFDFSSGQYDFLALVHEVGHALGLEHPFEGSNTLPTAEDNYRYTVMSYTAQEKNIWVTLETTETSTALGTSTSTSYSSESIYPGGPTLYDIAAIQHLYGANTNYRITDDVYQYDPTKPFVETIWDAGGTDTISAVGFSESVSIDLREGAFSSLYITQDLPDWVAANFTGQLYDGENNLAISYGTVIENAMTGSGADVIYANDHANTVHTGAGDDQVFSLAGNDLIYTQGGSDSVDGGAGLDKVLLDGQRSGYQLNQQAQQWSVQNGQDNVTLTAVERVEFNDVGVALDLSDNAGTVALLIGALFGAEAVANPTFVKIGLQYLDSGRSYDELIELAMAAASFERTPAGLVDLLYSNIVGVAPSESVRDFFIENYQQPLGDIGLVKYAADVAANYASIDHASLSQSGIEYSLQDYLI